MPHEDWSWPSLRDMKVAGVMRLAMLADIRKMIDRHLAAEFEDEDTWRHVAVELKKVAKRADPEGGVSV